MEVYHTPTLWRTCTGCYSVIPLSRVETGDSLDCFSVRHEQATVTCYCDEGPIARVFWTHIIPGPRPRQGAAVYNCNEILCIKLLSSWKLWYISVLKWIQKNSKMMSTHLYIFRNRPPNSRCLLLPYTSRIWFCCYRSGRSLRHTDSGAGRRRWGTGQCGVEWMTPVKHSPRFLGHNTCL